MDDAAVVNPFTFLERNAKSNPSGIFLASPDQTLTNSEAHTSAKQIAFELRRLGVKPGDLVAIDVPEILCILFYQALFHEAAAVTVLPKGYVHDGSFEIDWMFSSAAEPPQGARQLVAVDTAFLGHIDENPTGISPREYESGDSLFRVTFSSGTTGRPKAIASNIGAMEDYTADSLATWMRGDPFVSFLGAASPLGIFAVHLSVVTERPYLALGANVPATTIDLISKYRATSIKASPAQLASLVAELEKQNRTLPDLETVYTVGTSMPPALSTRLRAATAGCEIFALYGSTEAGMSFARYYDTDDPFDVGHVFPGVSFEIVDDDDKPLADGETGRIRVKGPLMSHEYLGDTTENLDVFRDGWFYPGDLGFIRPDGGLSLAGRFSELINAGGVKIDPNRIDLFAVAQPHVKDAASFGYTNSAGVKQVGIALVTDDEIDVQDLIRRLEKEFGYAAPKLVARIDAIPRNAMGKPLRLDLAEKYKES